MENINKRNPFEFKTQVQIRRDKLQSYPPKNGGGMSLKTPSLAEKIKNHFEENYSSQIQPQIEKLSRISELTEQELRDIFQRVFLAYIAHLLHVKRERLNRQSSGSSLPFFALLEDEISRDLPSLLFDFGIAVKQVKTYSAGKIKQFEKLLIFKIMQKHNPYLLKQTLTDPILVAEYSESDIKTALARTKDGQKFLQALIPILKRLYADHTIRDVCTESEIRRALILYGRNDGEGSLREFISLVQKGKEMLESKGIDAEAAKNKLQSFLKNTFLYKNRRRTAESLKTIERNLQETPYEKFNLALLAETQNNTRLKGAALKNFGERLSLSPIILDIYLAQFFKSIFTKRKLSGYQTLLNNHVSYKQNGPTTQDYNLRIERIRARDESFARVDWNILIEETFPEPSKQQYEEVVEQLRILNLPEDKIARAITIIKAEAKEEEWQIFKNLILMNLSEIPLDLLKKIEEGLK